MSTKHSPDTDHSPDAGKMMETPTVEIQFCDVCTHPKQPHPGIDQCKCTGVQPYSKSMYPGEIGMSEIHPNNGGEQWYRRQDIDPILARVAGTDRERNELKAEMDRQRQRMNAEMTEVRAENAEYRDTLVHIVEYWNRSENDKAMADALYHFIEEADAALAKYAPAAE